MKKNSIALFLLAGLMMTACSSTPAPTSAPTPETTPAPTSTPEAPAVEYRNIEIEKLAAEGMKMSFATVYGIYNQEGDAVDSSIQTTVYVNDETQEVVYIDVEEALLPVTAAGAEGWAVLTDESAAALGDAILTVGEIQVPAAFELNGLVWTGTVQNDQVTYTSVVNGADMEFMEYITTQEGGAWYHANLAQPARLLDSEGKPVVEIKIGTKASIEHGVGFWPSPITFPGNIELIKNYVYDHGTNYGTYPENTDIVKNEAGEWVVADVTTGATLAGTPNYLNLIKQASELIAAGQGMAYPAE
ncbi:hypothetical protein [Holdemania massiliensis]|uniref:hypothetical protein n=1 Tax=Holdemania massiliensis TaxID=1468449 RepID=UPI003520B5F9